MSPPQQLGELQLAIMRVLWDRGEATAAEVHSALQAERGLAFTTISTMLAKMEDKGVVRHRAEGRRFVYQPTISEGEVRRSMVGALTRSLFNGDAFALVNHLISTHDIDPDELSRLKALIEEHEGGPAQGPGPHKRSQGGVK